MLPSTLFCCRLLAAMAIGFGSIACATSSNDGAAGAGGGSGGGAAAAAGSGGGHSTGDAGVLLDGGNPNDGNVFPTDAKQDACSGDEATATRIPTDIIILLDTSGSMTLKDAKGKPKFTAVEEALNAFVNDPMSADLSVGLQFFPLNNPGVPKSCTASSQCGVGGPCTTGVCLASIIPCETCSSLPIKEWVGCDNNTQCGSGWTQQCARIGADSDGFLCLYGEFGCYGMEPEICLNELSCDVDRYKSLAVPVRPIAAAGPDITAAMAKIEPTGSTPTHAALSGALAAAQDHQAANPTHNTLILFATDGLPTSCEPTDIGSIVQVAAQASSASPSIRTFVIGIFTAEDLTEGNPQGNLNKIAAAGGTSQATIIAASAADVVQEFLNELEKIRGSTVGCEYAIPEPAPGKQLNFKEVNVEYTPGGGTKGVIPFVGDRNECGPAGGWHYDVAPEDGTPTKIVLCEATCDTVQADPNAKINFALGCLVQGPR